MSFRRERRKKHNSPASQAAATAWDAQKKTALVTDEGPQPTESRAGRVLDTLGAGGLRDHKRKMHRAVLCHKGIPFLALGKGMRHMSDDGYYIYVAYITTRDGRRIYASSYGLKAFRIWVKADTSSIKS